jgi:hypothetical protein
MILTPDLVKHSIEQYNSRMEREQQEKLVAKILEASNVIAKAGRQGQANHILLGQEKLDEITKATTLDELFGYNDKFKVYVDPTKTKRIVSDIDPYGEENWEI